MEDLTPLAASHARESLLRADLDREVAARHKAEGRATALEAEVARLRAELHEARGKLNALAMERRAAEMGMPRA